MSDPGNFRRYTSHARLAHMRGQRMTFGDRRRVTTYLNEELFEETKQRALRRGISLAAMVRLALRSELER